MDRGPDKTLIAGIACTITGLAVLAVAVVSEFQAAWTGNAVLGIWLGAAAALAALILGSIWQARKLTARADSEAEPPGALRAAKRILKKHPAFAIAAAAAAGYFTARHPRFVATSAQTVLLRLI